MATEISGTTTLYCLLGNPAKHSLSPRLHNFAFRELSIDSRYLAFEVTPENFEAAVRGLTVLGVGGFNLTMPYKNMILPYLAELSEAATLCGSVNTVVNEGGILKGYTTDGIGYVRSLRASGFDPSEKKITLLGGGGAAESLIVQLALEHAAGLTVCKRGNATFKKTVSFCEKVSAKTGCPIRVIPMEDEALFLDAIAESELLTNATNVGMEPEVDATLIPKKYLFPELFVSDIIYHPKKTRLLKDAEEIGCRTLNGLPMLLYQGAEAFRLWTGREMPVDKVQEAVFSDNA